MRTTHDSLTNHLRSLEALNENTDHMQMVTLIISKFPNELREHLELHKEEGKKWSQKLVLDMINKYIKSKEAADIKQTALDQDEIQNDDEAFTHSTTEAIVSHSSTKRGGYRG